MSLFLSAKRARKFEAITFSILVVGLALLPFLFMNHSYSDRFILGEGGYYSYSLEGGPWNVVIISLESTHPVTICITDKNGMAMLAGGRSALCYYRATSVTELNKLWRFPERGDFYVVIMSESSEKSVVSISLKELP